MIIHTFFSGIRYNKGKSTINNFILFLNKQVLVEKIQEILFDSFGGDFMYLTEYTRSYYSAVENFCVSTEHLRKTCEPFRSIELCKTDPNRHAILGIDDEKLVAFFVLHHLDDLNPYAQQQQRLLIRNFLIDYRHLGQGYTKKVLTTLKEYIQKKYPLIDTLLVMVNEEQTVKLALYKKLGFKDTGLRRDNYHNQSIILQCGIKELTDPVVSTSSN